ncbi:hypothetical protein PXK01_13035 [Phaeobacter sp. PT47_59]|uniref:hypothetical protein n=1 Tax=Phaeobacter sp. PT47_59 TaxID=3029979 RepID=UPI002380BA47|nr:hypothetical protein [Phaeobacter sp. PT47_59]MDE4175082.1 hypothetical protein [Phaeobacter sp. PT47_59]
MPMDQPNMPNLIQTDVVCLEQRRNDLAIQLEDVECTLWNEMVNIAIQLERGNAISSEAALVLARNDLPDFEDWD